MKCTPKIILAIGASARPMAAFSGFYESPGPPPSSNVRGIVPSHCHGHQNGQQSFCLLSPWRPPRQYGASSRPMVAFSGFYESHGPLPPLHGHGYQNGQQRRYICSLSPLLLFDQHIAKRPCYGPFKLTPSYDINLIGVINLCVSYWPPPPTMGAISATIVASGQTQF